MSECVTGQEEEGKGRKCVNTGKAPGKTGEFTQFNGC